MLKQYLKFTEMNPDLYGEGLSRIEHFDLTTPQARPFRELTASTCASDINNITAYTRGVSNTIYALGVDAAGTKGSVGYWRGNNQDFATLSLFSDTATFQTDVIHFYNGNIYGLLLGSRVWKMTTAMSFTKEFLVLDCSNSHSNFVTHSKDNFMYVAGNNTVYRINGTETPGASATSVYVDGNTNFYITTLAEYGSYLFVGGYDVKTRKASGFLLDIGQTSITTTIENYSFEVEYPYFSATIGGTLFLVSVAWDSSNTSFTEKTKLIIRYIASGQPKIKDIFQYDGCIPGGFYLDSDALYFTAQLLINGEQITPVDLRENIVVFKLDNLGKLTIAQNVDIALAVGSGPSGLIKDGEGFWIGAGVYGQWNSSGNYPTTYPAFFETTKISSKDLSKNIDVVGGVVSFNALPSGASVVVKTRMNEETAWTTVETFDTDNAIKGSFIGKDLSTARERQFRVESYGGAVITGFQVQFEEVNDEVYG